MKRKNPSRSFIQRQEKVRRKATELIERLGDFRLAVPLRPLAEYCRAKVEFRPLFAAGATAVGKNGFRVYCNCEADDVRDWTERFADPADEGRSLPVRERFTIAHELAHTFFYDMGRNGRLEYRFEVKSGEDVTNLERLCDDGASYLLIPKLMLHRRLSGRNWFDPEYLWSLCLEFGVSANVLIIRLQKERLMKLGKAAFVISRWREGPNIAAYAMDSASRRMFPGIGNGSPLNKLRLDAPDLQIFGGSEKQVICTIDAYPVPQQCELRYYKCSKSVSLLTASLIW